MPIAAQEVEPGTALKAAHGDKVSYTIEVSVNDPDYGTAYADLTSAEAGTTISLTATPNDGYSFAGWQVVSGGIQITDNKFIMPEENVKITAVFEKELPPYIPPITPPATMTHRAYCRAYSKVLSPAPSTSRMGRMNTPMTSAKSAEMARPR